jgi:hypothetical protein
MKVKLNIYNNSICNDRYIGDRKLKQGIIESQICAGVLEGGKDACQVLFLIKSTTKDHQFHIYNNTFIIIG